MADVVKAPAGGAFGEWRTANFAKIQEKAAAKPGGIGRGGVAKMASEMWKQMPESEQAPWQKKYQEHAAAFAAYKSSDAYVRVPGVLALRTEKRKLKEDPKRVAKLAKKNDPNRPKRPAGGAFGRFLARNRSVFQKECAGKPITAVTKLASEKWKVLSALDKKPFEEEFHAKQKEFKEAMKSYVPPAGAAPEADDDEGDDEDEDEGADDKEEKTAKKARKVTAAEKKTGRSAAAKKADGGAAKTKKTKVAAVATPARAGRGRPSKGTPALVIELSDEVLAAADKAGYKSALNNLAGRGELKAQGFTGDALLKALKASDGLVNKAKSVLLGK